MTTCRFDVSGPSGVVRPGVRAEREPFVVGCCWQFRAQMVRPVLYRTSRLSTFRKMTCRLRIRISKARSFGSASHAGARCLAIGVCRTFDGRSMRALSPGSTAAVAPAGVHGAIVLQCQDLESELTRRDVLLNGLEVHKFIPFVTFSQRVQVGLNVGGGFGFMSGHVDVADSRPCTRAPSRPGVS